MLSWFPQNISTFGGDIDQVFTLIYRIVGVWFLAAEGMLIYFVLRYRRRPGRAAAYVRGDRWGQLAWVLVPAVVVLALDLSIDSVSAPAWARIKERLPATGMDVIVTAKQFNWRFTYPGPDGRLETPDDVTVDNELHVQAGENVRFALRSEDVLHSFFIPAVRLKQDIIPGRTIKGWFNVEPAHAGTTSTTYELPCAELCGFGHYTMRGFLVVHTPDDWKKWAAEHLAPPPAAQ